MPIIMVHDHACRGVPHLLLDETHALILIQRVGDETTVEQRTNPMNMIIATVIFVFIVSLLFLPGLRALAVGVR